MEGWLSESGLYHIQEFSNPPTLTVNPYSWNNKTNSLFLEAPTGVGFSYCETAAECVHDDTTQSVDNLAALVSFFTAYPELQKNDFWITGESYAGIYIPTLAYQVYNYNVAKPAVPINIKGILVGNGCIGNAAGHCGNDPTGINDYHDIQQWKGHALISETTYDAIMKACDWPNESNKCQQLLNQAAQEVGDIDVYYLYNTCSDPAITRGAPVPSGSMLDRVRKARQARGVTLDPNCFGTGPTLEAWANQASVKAALHVAEKIDYALCSNNRTFRYSSSIADERVSIYPTLLDQSGMTVVIYNGEADLCVPYTDNEWWVRSMNYTVSSPWTAWTVQGEEGDYVGGYLTTYANKGNKFHFATVRGAGHMVPETRPEASLAMLSAFLGL